MIEKIKGAFGKTYKPLNLITLSKTNLTKNYSYLSKISSSIKVAPVLKSNAYGHGIAKVAKILDKNNLPMFCVDSLYEAYELQKANIKTPILIMGYLNPENLKVKRLPFSYCVYDLTLLKAINEYQPGAQVHIKVDTGMHRLGVQIDQLEEFLKKASNYKNVKIVGLMSHLASADEPQHPQNKIQIENFQKAKKIISKYSSDLKWFHLAASDGLINFHQTLSKFTNLSRVGLALYGVNPKDANLKPVLELKSHIAQVKNIQKGEYIGYSGTFKANKKMTLGILPIGYNDGVDRRLSNAGEVKVKGKSCPIVGRLSMNIAAIDVSKVANAAIGDEVTVISKNSSDKNSLLNLANICKTIPYELLVHLSPTSIRREVI